MHIQVIKYCYFKIRRIHLRQIIKRCNVKNDMTLHLAGRPSAQTNFKMSFNNLKMIILYTNMSSLIHFYEYIYS